ncbi:hypothetical protein Tco_1408078 [Tanacetum coccineum]
MDDSNITMEEYIRLEEEKLVGMVRSIETEFPTIVFDDTFTSQVALSCEPTVSPLNDNQINFRISFGESNDEDYTIFYPNKLKSDEDNYDKKVGVEQPWGDVYVIPLSNEINTDDGAYAQGSNKLLKTSHDTSRKNFKTEIFIMELNVDIMT